METISSRLERIKQQQEVERIRRDAPALLKLQVLIQLLDVASPESLREADFLMGAVSFLWDKEKDAARLPIIFGSEAGYPLICGYCCKQLGTFNAMATELWVNDNCHKTNFAAIDSSSPLWRKVNSYSLSGLLGLSNQVAMHYMILERLRNESSKSKQIAAVSSTGFERITSLG